MAGSPDEGSSPASGFKSLLKPFMWAGTILPGMALRKTTSPKAGAEDASRKRVMVPEVLQAPAWKTLSTRSGRSRSENHLTIGVASQAACNAVDMLESQRILQRGGHRSPIVPFSKHVQRSNSEPAGRDMVRQGVGCGV